MHQMIWSPDVRKWTDTAVRLPLLESGSWSELTAGKIKLTWMHSWEISNPKIMHSTDVTTNIYVFCLWRYLISINIPRTYYCFMFIRNALLVATHKSSSSFLPHEVRVNRGQKKSDPARNRTQVTCCKDESATHSTIVTPDITANWFFKFCRRLLFLSSVNSVILYL